MSLICASVLADSLNTTTSTSETTTTKQIEEKTDIIGIILKVVIKINKKTQIYPFFLEPQPESETVGACSKQSNAQIQKRNCRYGKCEQIKNGTDFSCHCDEVNSKLNQFFFCSS